MPRGVSQGVERIERAATILRNGRLHPIRVAIQPVADRRLGQRVAARVRILGAAIAAHREALEHRLARIDPSVSAEWIDVRAAVLLLNISERTFYRWITGARVSRERRGHRYVYLQRELLAATLR